MARTNLDSYLRTRAPKASEMYQKGVLGHPFWIQTLKLARALHRILDYETDNLDRHGIDYGYHFDLKPTNILVEEPLALVISDFGQAYFKRELEGRGSQVFCNAASESYAPPEIDNPRLKSTRRYDIWSLGCIFLEICTFIVLGDSGVRELDQRRISAIGDGSQTNDRFFQRVDAGIYKVKPQVADWLEGLPTKIEDGLARRWVEEFVGVVTKMLEPDPNKRTSSKEVCEELSRILNGRPKLTSIKCEPTEFEINGLVTSRIRQMSYNLKGFWDTGAFRLTGNDKSLFVHTWEDAKWTRTPVGERSDLNLVLRYALHDDDSRDHFETSSIYIRPANDNVSSITTRVMRLFSSSGMDNFLLQEALLGQKVIRSFELHFASIEIQDSIPKMIHNRLLAGSPKSRGVESSIKSLQLWTQSSTSGFPAERVEGTSQYPLHACVRPADRRIVLFGRKRIVLIWFSENLKIQSLPEGNGATLNFGPDIASGQSTFLGLVIDQSDRNLAPGIPLKYEDLEYEEDRGSVKIKSIRLVFGSAETADIFRRTYKRMRSQWAKDLSKFDELKHLIGPSIGYERNI